MDWFQLGNTLLVGAFLIIWDNKGYLNQLIKFSLFAVTVMNILKLTGKI